MQQVVSEPKIAPDKDLLSRMDERWSKLEQSMRDQLDSQLGQYKDLLNAENGNRKGRLRVGELESDTDDLLVTRDELAGKLRDSYEHIRRNKGEIDGMKDMQTRQNLEMEELRRQIAARAEHIKNVYIENHHHETQAAAPVIPIIEEKRVTIVEVPKVVIPTPKSHKKIHTPIKSIIKSPIKPIIVETPIEIIERVEEEVVVAEVVKAIPIVEEIVVSDFIDIVFSIELNPDLCMPQGRGGAGVKETAGGSENVVITLLKDISVEDLIFELRHGVATQLSVPLNRVVLELYGKTVTMGLDVEEEEDILDAEKAAVLAANGNLLVKIRRGKLLNDSQLDLMVNQYEGQQLLGNVSVPTTSSSPLKKSSKMSIKG